MGFRDGMLEKEIDLQMEKVEFGQRLKAGIKQAGFGVLFDIKYHPKQIMKKVEHLLYRDESVKRLFTPPSMLSYRSARKLSSYLIRAKVYPLERKRGSYKCGNLRCLLWKNIEHKEHLQVPLQENPLRQIIIFAVMINAWFTFWPAKLVRNNIHEKELIDLDHDGITIKKAIGKSYGVKRLNKNLWMSTFWVIGIKALKEMLAPVKLIKLTVLFLIEKCITGWGLLKP